MSEELTDMTNEELIAEKQSTGKSLSICRLAIRHNEMTGYGNTANTRRQRHDETLLTKQLTEINEVLVSRGLEPEDIEKVTETYGYSGAMMMRSA